MTNLNNEKCEQCLTISTVNGSVTVECARCTAGHNLHEFMFENASLCFKITWFSKEEEGEDG